MSELETRYGMLAIPDKDTDLIGRFLARYGEWAWDEVRFVASTLPEHGARVLDVGAFLGTFGLGIDLQRDIDYLCLVEANSEVIPFLRENVRRNCRAPATVVDGLLGWPGFAAHEGCFETSNLGSLSFVTDPVAGADVGHTEIPHRGVLTLPELRAEHGAFDLLKLDVEGMELGILHSDAEFLATGETSIWVECIDDPGTLELARLLLSWGQDAYYFAFPAHNRDNFRGDDEPIFPFAYEAGLLVAPKSRPALDAELAAHQCILRQVRSVDDVKDALWRTPRWGQRDWVGASAPEIAALAGRKLRGESYETYLGRDWRPRPVPDDGVWNRLDATELGLKSAESLAVERLNRLEVERERAAAAEARLARASAEALDWLSELGAERERADAAEARLAQASAEALDWLSELGVERERSTSLELRATSAERRAAELEANAERRYAKRLRGIAASTMNALRRNASVRHYAGILRRSVVSKPRLHALLRRTRAFAAKLVRPTL